MTTFLLFGDPLRNPEMRHEVGEPVGDDLIFLDHEGRRIVVGSILEEAIFTKREDAVDEFWSYDELGGRELVKDESVPLQVVWPELVLRAVTRTKATFVIVPPSFPVAVADHLRDHGVKLEIDGEAWAMRRRAKSPIELEGIERAQRAADTAMLTAARMLREAEPTADGHLRFEGEIVTAEWIRETMTAELLSQGAEGEEILVQSGDAWTGGHELGSGPILPDRSCIVDVFPRDRRSGAYSDMTRTFVPGRPSDELQELHSHCRAALDIAYRSLKPGSGDAYANVSEYFHDHGFPTQLHHDGSESLKEGFFHALGHGVGLDVHERPRIGLRSDDIVEGDVVAVEPGLYVPGVGGVRLEDTVFVTADGVEHLTDPYPYELAP